MENAFLGTIIEESLFDKSVLSKLKILKTRISTVVESHKTPWLSKWTLHTIEIPNDLALQTAQDLSKALEKEHNWYADFKNKELHYIIFRNKVFKVDRTSKKQYEEAKQYGLSLGIPEYQVNFSPQIKV
ncbi:MAG: hypothetical protein NTY48_06700 [Candidatus Diapherotrites archaeon]|nr:hypothetical protein [Candidatus Diapherotrites archaeon]